MAELVETVRNLQTRLNDAVTQLERDSVTGRQQQDTGKTLHLINAIATKLAATTASPVRQNLQLGLQPLEVLCVRVAIDLNLFELVNGPVNLETLVNATGADRVLLLRLVRSLTTFGVFTQNEENDFLPTERSKNLATVPSASWIKLAYDSKIRWYGAYPGWLAERKYQTSGDMNDNLIKSVTGKSYFDQLSSEPARQELFNFAMQMQEQAPANTRPTFPFDLHIPHMKFDQDSVALVDIGGGNGQALQLLRSGFPDLPGRLVLQDVPATIAKVNSVGEMKKLAVETQEYDFFTPQPVKGAKFYYLRRILHDWPDDSVAQILAQIYAAMYETASYSRLLIQDNVLPKRDLSMMDVLLDLNMMVNLCGAERSMTQWEQLLDAAGFTILNIYKAQSGSLSFIEAVIKTSHGGLDPSKL